MPLKFFRKVPVDAVEPKNRMLPWQLNAPPMVDLTDQAQIYSLGPFKLPRETVDNFARFLALG